jgi:hypothetical protein
MLCSYYDEMYKLVPGMTCTVHSALPMRRAWSEPSCCNCRTSKLLTQTNCTKKLQPWHLIELDPISPINRNMILGR